MNTNLKRPKGISVEDEDELFEFQQEFLNQKIIQPSAAVVKLSKKDHIKKDFESGNQITSSVLSDIIEKPIFKEFHESSLNEFNKLPKIEKLNFKELSQPRDGKKKSLFARNLENKGNLKWFYDLDQVLQPKKLRDDAKIKVIEKQTVYSDDTKFRNQIITGEGLINKKEVEQIHLENLELLSKMKPEEIMAEKRKLMQGLEPKIIAYIKRKSNSASPGFQIERDNVQKSERPSDQEIFEQLAIKPNKKWLNMNKIEYEKLEWMCKPRDVVNNLKDSKSARFCFEGNVISPEEEISVTKALHHHGNEPDLAGYTLDELFHLARSKFNQQRVLALQTIGNILKKCHYGDYHEIIKSNDETQNQELENDKNNLLNQLIEGGVLFLLRWNLDDQTESILIASLEAINNLLHHAGQEDVLDYYFDMYEGHENPCLHPFAAIFSANKQNLTVDKNLNLSEEKDLEQLRDDEFIRVDLIRGLFRMNLIDRFFYLINTYEASNKIKIESVIFSILFRCVRHSREICFELFERYPSLIDLIGKKFLPTFIEENNSNVKSLFINTANTIKLLRLVSNAGPTIALNIYMKFNLKVKIVNYLTLYKYVTEPSLGDLVVRLETETIRLLKTYVLYSHKEMGYESIIDLYEILIDKLKNLMGECKENSEKKISQLQSLISLFNWLIKSGTEHDLNFLSEISTTIYSLISSFVQKKFKSLFNNQIQLIEENINFNLYSNCMNYMVDYLEKIEFLSPFDKMSVLSSRKKIYIETLIETLIKPIVHTKNTTNLLIFEKLVLSKLINISVYGQELMQQKFKKICSNNLSYLPTICHIYQFDNCDVTRQSPFGFLASFMRLYNFLFMNKINLIDDNKFSNIRNLLKNSYIGSYLKCYIKNNDQSRNSPLQSFYHAKMENWFVLNILKTALNVYNFQEDLKNNFNETQLEKINSEEQKENQNQKRFFYIASLSLLLKLKKGDESFVDDLFTLYTFNSNFWIFFIENKNENLLIQYFEKLELKDSLPQIKFNFIDINFAQSETIQINKSFIEDIESKYINDFLNQIKFSYLQNLYIFQSKFLEHSKRLKKFSKDQLNTLFLSTDYSNQNLLKPDWIYEPILMEKIEFSKITQQTHEKKSIHKVISNLSNCLKFVYLLEIYFDKDYLDDKLNSTLRYIKLLFIYLFDPEVFLDKEIITLMYLLFFKSIYDRKQPLKNLNFNQKFSDIISFYDFYQHLLNQYDSSSFGDYLFSQYLIVPLQQCYPVMYRQLFWSDFLHLLKYMKFDNENNKMLVPLKYFVQPNEKNLHMIRLYSQVLLDPNDFNLLLSSKLGYAIIVANLNSFVFEHNNERENQVEFDFKKLLVKKIMSLSEKIRNDIIFYKNVDESILHFDQLPENRKKWLDQLML